MICLRSTWKIALVAGFAAFFSCNKNNDPDPEPVPADKGKYIVLTAESGQGAAGYYAAYDNLPSGNVDNIGGFSLQARAYGGFRHYKNWIFNRATLAGETGVVRYSLNAAGVLEQSGFIKCGTSAQHLVVNETTGFYFDADRGKTKIQKFNPTTMQRTGEIDLSSLVEKGNGISTNVFTGNQTIAAKDGKLFVNITYSREGGSGHNDNTRKYTLAVIDIATEKPEKTIVHSVVKNQGHSPSEYPAWTLGSDGSLYFVTTGWDYDTQNVMVPQKSRIFRIKAGETAFDEAWSLVPEDLGLPAGGLFWSIKVLNGKLYADLPQQAIELPGFGNLSTPFYDVYAIEPGTKNFSKVSGMPSTIFGHSTGNLELVDNELFIRVINADSGVNSYYKLNSNGTSASPAFAISRGGQAKGFSRLSGE